MPAKTKKKTTKPRASKAVVKNNTTSKRRFREQSRLLQVLIVLAVLLLTIAISTLVYDRMKANDLQAKANRWTSITPPGVNSGVNFVACKQPFPGGSSGYDATIVAAKSTSLKLTKRDAEGKPLSTNPPMPQIYSGVYAKSTKNIRVGYEYEWVQQLALQTVPASANVWWANEVTATKLSSRNPSTAVNGSNRLLVYGMSDQGNAPTFRRSGSGQLIVTGVFNGLPPQPDNYDKATDYLAARTAWEAKAPTIASLKNCN